MSVYSISGASQRAFKRRLKTQFRQCLRSRLCHHPSSKSERMLTPTTVGGLKQFLKCVMRWGLHHQSAGYVVSVSSKHTACNPSEYFTRTIIIPILDHLLSELDKRFSSYKKLLFKVYTWYHQCWYQKILQLCPVWR